MREPEERPGLPLWLPEPYHGPQPPWGFTPSKKPKQKPASQRATGRRVRSDPTRLPSAVIRVTTVIVGATFVTVIVLVAIILAKH